MKQGLAIENDSQPVQQYDLVVLDDLQNEMKSDSHITSLFLKQSHHRQFFVILLQQNIYGDKEQRYRNANCHYWVGFQNPRNQRQVSEFLSRMYTSGGKRAIEGIFKHILDTEGNYGYLFVDFTPNMRADLRLRSHIFTSPMHIFKVNERGGFNEWLALSTLDEKTGSSNMTYDNMVLVPKARYQSLVGGARKSDVKAWLEPKKAYAEEAAREVLDFKITPETVSDYYNKLSQFSKIRRDFFLPKAAAPTPPAMILPSPAHTTSRGKEPPRQRDNDLKLAARKRLMMMDDLDKSKLKKLERIVKRKMLPPSTKQLPARLRGNKNRFQEYGQFSLTA